MSLKTVCCIHHTEYAANFKCSKCNTPRCFNCKAAKTHHKQLDYCLDCLTEKKTEDDTMGAFVFVVALMFTIYSVCFLSGAPLKFLYHWFFVQPYLWFAYTWNGVVRLAFEALDFLITLKN